MSVKNIIGAILVILICLFEILLVVKKKRKWLASVPLLLWMLQSLAFLITNNFIEDKKIVNAWSQNTRLQGYATLLFLGIYRYILYFKKTGANHLE